MNRLFEKSPLLAACLFGAALVVLALGLALLFGLRPWETVAVSPAAVGLSLVGTVPLALLLLGLSRVEWAWSREITRMLYDWVAIRYYLRRRLTANTEARGLRANRKW